MPRALKAKRNARVMELYDLGTTWQAIADQLAEEGFEKVTRQNVGRIIHEELKRGEK